MVDIERSCLVDKLSYYVDLQASDRALLARMAKHERPCARRRAVQRAGQRLADVYVVKHCWSYTTATLPHGRQQLLMLHFPGEPPEQPNCRWWSFCWW